ncbi:MAG: TatD family hydrolase [Synergistaceae bacterium]|nr:TatD family hydrolase [Synergistaceae bacterium]
MNNENKSVRLFDSHCHLNMKEFHGDLEPVLERARVAGVARLLLAACDEISSRDVLRLAGGENGSGVEIWASAGVHPHDAATVASGLPEELTDLSSNKHVRAIGEIGLDFYYDNSPRATQADVFERQIKWALKARKPILVHLRSSANRGDGDAYANAFAIMKRSGASECGGVIHCFSGEKRDAATALDMGFYISFAGPITYPKAASLREVSQYVPIDRILCETDSPYLAPQSRRGKRNEPALVREVYETVSMTRGIALPELAEAVWENAERLFLRNNTV